MRRHPLQSTPLPPLGLTLGEQRGGERSRARVHGPFAIGEHAEFSAQGEQLVVAQAELTPPGMVEPFVIVDEEGFIHKQATRLESAHDLRKQVPLQVVEHGDQLEGGGGDCRLLLEAPRACRDGGEPERLGWAPHRLKRCCVPVPGLDAESFLGKIERVPAVAAGQVERVPRSQEVSVLGEPVGGPLTVLAAGCLRSEEHTSELQSLAYLVCRLLLEKKKNNRVFISVRHAY